MVAVRSKLIRPSRKSIASARRLEFSESGFATIFVVSDMGNMGRELETEKGGSRFYWATSGYTIERVLSLSSRDFCNGFWIAKVWVRSEERRFVGSVFLRCVTCVLSRKVGKCVSGCKIICFARFDRRRRKRGSVLLRASGTKVGEFCNLCTFGAVLLVCC